MTQVALQKTMLFNDIKEVVLELVDQDALTIVEYLFDRSKVSEFIIAEDLDLELHQTRKLLYRLLHHNLVIFQRKKDKNKGWYICYWDFNKNSIDHLREKIRQDKLERLNQRLVREEANQFFLCKNACARMAFDDAAEHNFKCIECGEVMNMQDNARTIEFLTERIKELGVKQEE
ncbi:MAG: hypothetical protein H6502_05355 [Candidatus Woesearchaeota archaeon]|nr:MAG: hypothetical protein H6502_05355 [Candidatus Woesearchaeota archaeon]